MILKAKEIQFLQPLLLSLIHILDSEKQQIVIITGPNMAGKSALLRQTALVVLMAQMGCFVPAESARIGLVDKIFTRVGASDNISLGESTFMVEMTEASNILNNVTPRSLVPVSYTHLNDSLQTRKILGLPLRQTDSTFLQQRYETVFSNHSFTLII